MAKKSKKSVVETEDALKITPKKNRRKTAEKIKIEVEVNGKTKTPNKIPKGKKIWEVQCRQKDQSRIDSFFKSCAKISGERERKNDQMHIESFYKTVSRKTEQKDVCVPVANVKSETKKTRKTVLRTKQKRLDSVGSTTSMSDKTEGRPQYKRKNSLNKKAEKAQPSMCQPIECIDLCSDDDSTKEHGIERSACNKADKNNNLCEIKQEEEASITTNITIKNEFSDVEFISDSSEFTSNPPPSTAIQQQSISDKIGRSKRTPRPCPPYKRVEGTNFAVDAFQYGRIEGVKFYFLTHFHADHYVGLTGKFDMPIYLSQITASLVRTFIPVQDKYLHIVPLDDPIVVDGVQITAIDANHCPGAVMFLFKLPSGRCILHTGDFRGCSEMESHPAFWNNEIHTIYLDTTYLSNMYNFCTQTESIDQAKYIVEEFRRKHINKRILYICGSYVIGKEKFWSALAQTFNWRIWTEGNRKHALDAMKLKELNGFLCDNALEAEMHIISIAKVNYKSLCEYFQPPLSDKYDMLLAIRPSGWEKNSRPQFRRQINIVGIEYSEHSSHDELKRFVSYLKPTEVISTVPVARDPFVTGKVPPKWYNYKKLTPHSCFQPLISSYMDVTRQETNETISKTEKSFVNISPLKSTSNETDTIRDQFLYSPDKTEEFREIIGTENCRPSSKFDHYTSNVQNIVKIPSTSKRVRVSLDFNADADSDWLS